MSKKKGKVLFSRKVYSVSYGDTNTDLDNTVSLQRVTVVATDVLSAIAEANGIAKPGDEMFVWDVICLSRDRLIPGGDGIGPIEAVQNY